MANKSSHSRMMMHTWLTLSIAAVAVGTIKVRRQAGPT